jgi:aspartate aminotransferase
MLRNLVRRGVTIWRDVPLGPPDPILGIDEAFKRDTNPRKVNLGVGAYRDDDAKPWVLPSVLKAKAQVINLNHEYLPTQGLDSFRSGAMKLAYGDCQPLREGRIASVQALSGTGALRVGMAFLERFYSASRTVYIPRPTWGNHKNIVKDAGLQWKEYGYYNPATKGLDLESVLADLEDAPDKSIILLHACAHNPTGVDPNLEQWAQIHQVISSKHHLAFFDSAYQGFASGDPARDAAALRMFVKEETPVLLSQSFAKNFGLYGERAGLFSVLGNDSQESERLVSQLKIIGRPMYSNPPLFGARVVSTVLNTPELEAQWYLDLKTMSSRIFSMREALVKLLKEKGSPFDWSHITKQIGMFAFTGLNPDQVRSLTENHHIYLTGDGRISIAGLNTKNVEYVAEAIEKVSRFSAKR